MLLSSAYVVLAIADAVDVATIVSERIINLSIIDVDVPAPNGWQTLVTLRSSHLDHRVLMISGSEAANHAKEVDTEFLRKPFASLFARRF